jgi:heme/copper-type cytochrome/quinol oxidase subunit 4
MIDSTGIGVMIISFILGLIVSTVSIYLAAKLVGSDTSFLRAMEANILSGILAAIIIIIFLYIAAAYKSSPGTVLLLIILGLIIAFIAVLGVYKHMFNVGWGAAFGIIILSAVIGFILNMILALLFGISIYYLLSNPQFQSFISPLLNITNISQGFNLTNISSLANLTNIS